MSSSCENYGTLNGTACACPPGFGGATCSQPGCGGTLFQGSGRALASGLPFANLTSCSCEDGWTGTGCNVCQAAQACQVGFASVRGAAGALSGLSGGQNNALVCNTTPRVYSAGQMSCSVQVSLEHIPPTLIRSDGLRTPYPPVRPVSGINGDHTPFIPWHLFVYCVRRNEFQTPSFVSAAAVSLSSPRICRLTSCIEPDIAGDLSWALHADHHSHSKLLLHPPTQHHGFWT
ncbi:hypothetical protein BC628DRAFT_537563 [Trametes gibbosa]|nr:hypothetical protein BC628DRAFT_537563 [Trametes gibbosa]